MTIPSTSRSLPFQSTTRKLQIASCFHLHEHIRFRRQPDGSREIACFRTGYSAERMHSYTRAHSHIIYHSSTLQISEIKCLCHGNGSAKKQIEVGQVWECLKSTTKIYILRLVKVVSHPSCLSRSLYILIPTYTRLIVPPMDSLNKQVLRVVSPPPSTSTRVLGQNSGMRVWGFSFCGSQAEFLDIRVSSLKSLDEDANVSDVYKVNFLQLVSFHFDF
jgi:hypothetical protein